MRRKSAELSAHIRSLAVFAAGVLIGRMSRKARSEASDPALKRSLETTADTLRLAEAQRERRKNNR